MLPYVRIMAYNSRRAAMIIDDIEASDKWLNDPDEVSEEDFEASDDDFEMWMEMDVQPDSIVDAVTRQQYQAYLTKLS